MGNWRDLAALVLLAQLMTLSKGSTDIADIGAFEEILSKNLSIIVIDNKRDDILNETIRNVTSLNSEFNDSNNNNTVILNAMIKDEKELEIELKEAIESAASSGQVIMIPPPADRINLTKQFPVIVIETPADQSRSALKNTSGSKTLEVSNSNLDQEIAQSQTRPRSDFVKYANSENSENLEDLLAIAEYEPQRIDAKRIDQESSQSSSDQVGFTVETTNRPLAEVTHYDVPKRRNLPRKLQRISAVYSRTTPKPDLKISSTGQIPLSTVPSELDPVKIEEKIIKADRRQFSSPSTLHHKPIAVYTETLRDRRNPKIDLPATMTSIPVRLAHDASSRKTNPLAVSSSTDVTSTLLPGLSGNIKARLRNNPNINNARGPLRQNFHSSRIRTTQTSLASPFDSILGNQTSFARDKTIDTGLPTSGVTQANRRIDYYLTPQSAESSRKNRQSLTNEQLGFLTRYNLPSLVTGRNVNSRYPVASKFREIGSAKVSREEEEISESEDSSETTNPRISRTLTPIRGSYELSNQKITNRPPVLDYRKDVGAFNIKTTPIYNSYEEDRKEIAPSNHRAENSAYQRRINQPIVSTTPIYDSYEENEDETVPNNHRVENSAYQRKSNRPIVSTTPIYDSYEEKEEETAPVDHRVENVVYQRNRNQPIVSTTPVYDSYEESIKSKLLSQSQNSPEASTPIYDFYDDYKESANSKVAKNSPTSYEDDEESTENSKTVRTSPVASYEDYRESEDSKIVRNSRQPVTPTTPIDESYEDYKDAKPVKISVVHSSTPVYDSYEDYSQSDNRKLIPKQQSLIPDNVEYRERLPIKSHPVSTQHPNNYAARTIQPVPPINLLNNPIYQLHGLRSSTPVTGVYNPYPNYATRKPSISHDKSNIERPRGTANHRIVSTTPAYDSYEDTARTNSPSTTNPRITNTNYVEHRSAKAAYNGNDETADTKSTSPEKRNSHNLYRQRVSDPYAANPTNTPSPLPPQRILQPQWNLQSSIGKVSSPAYVESIESGNEYEDPIDQRAYNSDSREPKAQIASLYRETNKPVLSTRTASRYDSDESDERDVNSSPSGSAKLIEPHSADYGNRIKTRVVEENQRDRIVAHSNRPASSKTPRRGSLRISTLNHEDRGPDRRSHVDEVPVESVNRENVKDSSDYEDEIPSGSGHEEKHENYQTHEETKKSDDGGGEHKHEEGGGEKHEEDHHGSHGEKGKKGYKEWHEHNKGEKGYHDKESHDKEYEEKKGDKKKHADESEYHKEHHHEEKGDKEAAFGEKGEHQKGHSTKGQHVVHKKDEYEKKTEFYDESHEEDGEEKEGGHHEEHESEKGGHEKIGHHDSAHHLDKYGKKGEHEKGHHYHENKGHKNSDGHEEDHHHEEKYGKKGGQEEGKKWSYKKGDNGKKDS